jgi:hypothetical protein
MVGKNVIDITQLRKGMEVHAVDGAKLGTIAEVWVGTDPLDSTMACDEDLCSRVEVHAFHQPGGPLYIPYNALAAVAGHSVSLNVDAATAHTRNWHHRPAWLPTQAGGGISVGIMHAGLAQVRIAVPLPGPPEGDNS